MLDSQLKYKVLEYIYSNLREISIFIVFFCFVIVRSILLALPFKKRALIIRFNSSK